ncbi:effector-associated constant component EACC1 [Nonomuraea candida]|uniref:effector-associated constant component EACC1 n=1 Tax=Nonomuraea candida TaxID=359159 RepID=UPI0012FA4E96|nr:hypothetical protein [Nonomuraea candida]
MEVQIQVSGEDQVSEYTALWEWLKSERELAGRIRAVRRPPAEDELGDGLDLIALAVSSLGVAVAVAQTVPAYLAARRRSARADQVSVVVRKRDGEELEINSNRSIAELEPLIKAFLERGLDEE